MGLVVVAPHDRGDIAGAHKAGNSDGDGYGGHSLSPWAMLNNYDFDARKIFIK